MPRASAQKVLGRGLCFRTCPSLPVATNLDDIFVIYDPLPPAFITIHPYWKPSVLRGGLTPGRVFHTLRKPVWRANFALAEWREQEVQMKTLPKPNIEAE